MGAKLATVRGFSQRTFGVVPVFVLAALLVVFEEDGGDEGLQVHQVLVEVASVLVFPDATLQVVLPRLTGGENIDARTVIWERRQRISLHTKTKTHYDQKDIAVHTLLHRLVLRQLRHVLIEQISQGLGVGQQLLVGRGKLLVLLVSVFAQFPFGM